MSLLGNLVTQVAKSALGGDNNNQASNAGQSSGGMGGLGGMLGGMLGGGNQQANTNNNSNNSGGFGVDDILGSVLGGGSNVGAGGMGAVLGSVLGAKKGGGKGMLIATLLPMVLAWIQRNGGLSGALSQLQNSGLAQQASSWMSANSSNERVEPSQISKLFSQDEINQAVEQTGTDEHQVSEGLAELLPQVIDHLTPDGDLNREQEANSEISEILSQISGKLG